MSEVDKDFEQRVKIAKDRLDKIAQFKKLFLEIRNESTDIQAINAAERFEISLETIRQKILYREPLIQVDRSHLEMAEEFLRITGKL